MATDEELAKAKAKELAQAQWIGLNYPIAIQCSGGGLIVNGTTYIWDYANRVAVPEKEMVQDKERMKASEKARWEK